MDVIRLAECIDVSYIITLKFLWVVACSLCYSGWMLINCSQTEAEQVIYTRINEGI
jgi:hypothetical protein